VYLQSSVKIQYRSRVGIAPVFLMKALITICRPAARATSDHVVWAKSLLRTPGQTHALLLGEKAARENGTLSMLEECLTTSDAFVDEYLKLNATVLCPPQRGLH
jgi:hypothetical protein